MNFRRKHKFTFELMSNESDFKAKAISLSEKWKMNRVIGEATIITLLI